jgi:choline kinase
MRELHDGIELLKEERDGGPKVFQDYEKWVDHCEKLTMWLDKEVQSPESEAKAATESWRRRGYVFGVPWATFRRAVEKYRAWLVETCGGMEVIKQQLVFAHNDVSFARCSSVPILISIDSIWQSTSNATCHGIAATLARE